MCGTTVRFSGVASESLLVGSTRLVVSGDGGSGTKVGSTALIGSLGEVCGAGGGVGMSCMISSWSILGGIADGIPLSVISFGRVI
jgi:hypothetical protein